MSAESELYLLFDRSPAGMYRASEDGTFHYVNPALARMLGYTVEELLARNLARDVYIDPDARARLIAKYRPLGAIDGAKVDWQTRDGRRLIVELWGHVVETAGGTSFDAWVLDITDNEKQREALEQTATTLDLVMHQMPAIYWRIDADQRIVATGGASPEVLGYGGGRYIGKTLAEHHAIEPSSVDSTGLHARALLGEVLKFDSEYRGKALSSTIGPLRNAGGEIVGAIGTAVDVTRVRLLERRMVEAQRAESLGILAGGLAHDFNNLLVAVLGNADLALREIEPGKPGRAAIENIRIAGLRAAELTDQLLAYAGRGGAGTTRIEPAHLIDELLRITATSIPPQVRITTDLSTRLAVRADPAQLRQVMLNLIHNARDALAAHGGTISIRGEAVHRETAGAESDEILPAPPGSYVLLEVADDGPGMDAETARHVFEPFYTTKQSGHGLGLAAVLGIVRAHGGGIRVVTAPSSGAKFQVLWPAATSGERATPEPAVCSRTVLVIDDEDLVRDVVARMVEDLGYEALTAPDGASGLALADRADAVLVDMTMPRMSGADVIAELRRRHPDLPVVLCSGFDRDGRGPVKADAYLPKPFRLDALERTLAKLLPLRSV